MTWCKLSLNSVFELFNNNWVPLQNVEWWSRETAEDWVMSPSTLSTQAEEQKFPAPRRRRRLSGRKYIKLCLLPLLSKFVDRHKSVENEAKVLILTSFFLLWWSRKKEKLLAFDFRFPNCVLVVIIPGKNSLQKRKNVFRYWLFLFEIKLLTLTWL